MDERLRDLSNHRLEQAERCVQSAKLLAENGDYKGAANRSYYAIFHGMRSVLALERVDFAKHSGVSSYFRREYIRTGIFDTGLSDIIREAFEVRGSSDYDDYFLISKEEVWEQIRNAEFFCAQIKAYLLREQE